VTETATSRLRCRGLFPFTRRLRKRSERGAALVEAALVLPVLLLVVFGVFEFGFAFKNSLTITSATRSGSRVASALPRTADYEINTAAAVRGALLNAFQSGDLEYLTIYKADADTGEPVNGGGFETCTECYRYRWDASAQGGEGDWAYVAGAWPPLTQAACGDDAMTDYVGVYVRASHNFLTAAFGSSRTLTAHTVMRLEPVPTIGGTACAP
jgi:hypothetical protein